MKRKYPRIFAALLAGAFLAGCGGRAAHPVATSQPGDLETSCSSYLSEIKYDEQEIARLIPGSKKATKNLLLGATGYVLLVPWFYLDFSDAEREEIKAYCARHERLVLLSKEKQCNFDKIDLASLCSQSVPPPDKSWIFVYRIGFGGGHPVLIDDMAVGHPLSNTFVFKEVDPGLHSVKTLDIPSLKEETTFELMTEPSFAYYIRQEIQIIGGIKIILKQVTEKVGREEIRQCQSAQDIYGAVEEERKEQKNKPDTSSPFIEYHEPKTSRLNKNTSMNSAPNLDSDIVVQLKTGEEVTVIGEIGVWMKVIDANNNAGYVWRGDFE